MSQLTFGWFTRTSRSPRRRLSGFTLIELLVTIAIIGILASLLFTGIAGGMRAGKNVHCKSNLKQLGLAVALYVHDHQTFPLWYVPNVEMGFVGTYQGHGQVAGHYWTESLIPYVGHAIRGVPTGQAEQWKADPVGVFGCPSEKVRELAFYGYNHSGVAVGSATSPLGLGGNRPMDPKYGAFYLAPVREADVTAPSQMMAIADGLLRGPSKEVFPEFGYAIGRHPASWAPYMNPIVKSGTGWRRHNRRANVVFCDGHVEAQKLESMYFSRDPAPLRLWNRDNEPHPEKL